MQNDAPPILGVLAAVVAILVVAVVLPNMRINMYAWIVVFAPLAGLAMVCFPQVFALWTTGDYEYPLGPVRVVGWLLIAMPLVLLIGGR